MSNVSQLLESRGSRIGRWAGAAVVVCGLHAGAVGLALMQPEEEAEDFEGVVGDTMVVEMTLLPVAQPVVQENLAHAQQAQQEMRQTQEASKKVVEKLEKDIPPVDPSPAPDPEIVLPKAQPEEKEEPKEEAKDAVAEKPQQDRDQEAAAPPRQAVNVARIQASWQTQLVRQLNRHKRMPPNVRWRRGRWTVVVAFTVDRRGQVLAARITQGSGVPELDDEALAVLKRVELPPAPGEVPGETFDFQLPYNFSVN